MVVLVTRQDVSAAGKDTWRARRRHAASWGIRTCQAKKPTQVCNETYPSNPIWRPSMAPMGQPLRVAASDVAARARSLLGLMVLPHAAYHKQPYACTPPLRLLARASLFPLTRVSGLLLLLLARPPALVLGVVCVGGRCPVCGGGFLVLPYILEPCLRWRLHECVKR